MSERVTAEELKRVLVDGIVEYSEVSLEGFIARAADTIAALERDNAAKDTLIETSRQQVTALARELKQLRGGE